jgi:two-component system sensor histidine kinase KdpD
MVQFARAERATQLVLGATRRSRWAELTRGSVISRVIRQSGAIDVHVISSESERDGEAGERMPRPSLGIPRRRELTGWIVAATLLPVLTLAMAGMRDQIDLPANLLLYLLVVVTVAAIGGLWPALAASVAAFVLANYYFTDPLGRFSVAEAEDVIALLVFLVVGLIVSGLVTIAARRTAEAVRATSEAEALARLSGSMLGESDPLGRLMTELQTSFGVTACAILRREGASWRVESSAGSPIPGRPEDGQMSVPLDEDETLVLVGPGLDEQDLSLLRAFTAQLSLALESRQLRAEAALASGLAEANELRTALLAAVSHDLRTPLASIKASVSSLLQTDVDWTPEANEEFLRTIDEESDRLNTLVGNLLDMSRLQTGAVELVLRAVGLEEVVPRALSTVPSSAERVVIDVPETLPRVRADAALLERAVANVVDNALTWSPDELKVRVEGSAVGEQVDLRIVDRGPGVAAEQRPEMFRPFQRLGDRTTDTGVGLGLAVARGFMEAMAGSIVVEDTPGGGLTMVLSLPAAGA